MVNRAVKKTPSTQKVSKTNPYKRQWQQVKAPLGDKNMITMKMDVNQCYQVVLETVKDAFFPNGVNPAMGDIGFFTDLRS